MLAPVVPPRVFARPLVLVGALLGVGAGASGCDDEAAGGGVSGAARCVAPAGAPTSPRSIEEVVALVDALPSPVTLPCFLDALSRPLRIHATRSVFSAQPAVGARSPRIFLFFDGLRASIALAGVGSPLLEMGEIRDDLRSLKAEIEFPVAEPLAPQAPFERIMFAPNATSCSLCHADEQPAADVTFSQAFTSLALRPLVGEGVSIDALAAERASCDPATEPDRCATLASLFAQGLPVEEPFPAELATFY